MLITGKSGPAPPRASHRTSVMPKSTAPGRTKDARTIGQRAVGQDASQFPREGVCKRAGGREAGEASLSVRPVDLNGCIVRSAAREAGLTVRRSPIRGKGTMVMKRQDYLRKHEPCLHGRTEGAGHLRTSDRKQTIVLEFEQKQGTPTMVSTPLFDCAIHCKQQERHPVLSDFDQRTVCI